MESLTAHSPWGADRDARLSETALDAAARGQPAGPHLPAVDDLRLTVKGRRSGRERTVPVAVLKHGGERYLVSYRGLSDWALNLRATPEARLTSGGRTETITVEEVPEADRPPLLAEYRDAYGSMPTVTGVLDALPDPADHPVFRIRA
ncbi:nitroreductase family deazaflavin-dependent oxidoreductase [Streptomyces sp. NPDC102405]|uniref:nitroreductase family deazaflavin-dependent oxidoreductase n=1 Tax=Streptomyces sp. NPDC102405 TaxID=3366170 RepID=UPI0037FF69BD